MKVRKVMVSIEVETDAKMADLKEPGNWEFADNFSWKVFRVQQIQVNVVKGEGKK